MFRTFEVINVFTNNAGVNRYKFASLKSNTGACIEGFDNGTSYNFIVSINGKIISRYTADLKEGFHKGAYIIRRNTNENKRTSLRFTFDGHDTGYFNNVH